MPQRAIIVGANTIDLATHQYEMEELKQLCQACEIEVLDMITQNSDSINPQTYIRKGKLEELKTVIANLDCDTVIFNDELTASQINNIGEVLDVTIYDRTYVILEIFKRRATTKEAILQVDIASLKYMLPRLVGLREGLSRQRGAGGSGAHGRGQGETKLELDRRNISDRIAFLKKQLKELTDERSLQRKKRQLSNIPVVSLVGYTNSGKSSTLNAILNYSNRVKKEVFQKDMLFATLETASRLIKLENNHSFIVTDTVGFVHKLPTHLIEAFKSTLEEITESDLIIHVVDASNPNYEAQIRTTNEVLNEIGVNNIPIIYAFNKIDKVDSYFYIPPQYEKAIRISAKKDQYIDDLIKMIEKEVFQDEKLVHLLIPYDNISLFDMLKKEAYVIEANFIDNAVDVKAKLNPKFLSMLNEYLVK